MPKYVIERTVLVAILAWLVAAPAALATPGGGNSAATITASFADSCRDFAAHSSKDISHVEFHYADGRVVKDESISSHDYAIDGGAGDEVEFATVKSGTTSEQFDCVQSNRAPTALLEIQTPQCYDFWAGGLACDQSSPRTTWTGASQVPDTGGSDSGVFHWTCAVGYSLCPSTITFRGIGSSDPDGDITSWSLDFGDGTSASGSWSTAPPTEVAHTYPNYCGDGNDLCVITLTVTDSAGQSDTQTILMYFLDISPD
jgi:hypothetical protein